METEQGITKYNKHSLWPEVTELGDMQGGADVSELNMLMYYDAV